MMDWQQLLCGERLGGGSGRADVRSPFERDYGRILFSNAFRRLGAKTQVFPVPDNDHVHTRLTHSLEVADVGRTLGKLAGAVVAERHDLGPHASEDIAHVVAAACLAHDLGNPPFGHAGEEALGQFFEKGPGASYQLSPRQRADLEHFEGNAQGFRLLTRLAMNTDQGGMRLTLATLGAFGKYPQTSELRKRDPARPVSGKKFGCFDAEAELMAEVAAGCGLLPAGPSAWCRHPLAWLMEAADDICYSVLDLEDGCLVGLISADEARVALAPILDRRAEDLAPYAISALRAQAISVLVEQAVAAFCEVEPALLAGTHEVSLCDMIPAAKPLAAIYDLNMARCYRAPVVLGLEQAGYNVIGGLLEQFCASLDGTRNPRLLQMIPDGLGTKDQDLYQRLLVITDFISGMTDRYAVRLYRNLTGIELQSV
ncbi:MAG: dNTP triphosphohydrolase [Planctomycetota bacterium]|jgi:dGTPase|nr:dNTP triphosphohydrolase [Planctomycetota bacterium]